MKEYLITQEFNSQLVEKSKYLQTKYERAKPTGRTPELFSREGRN